jgi:hypothetical protein
MRNWGRFEKEIRNLQGSKKGLTLSGGTSRIDLESVLEANHLPKVEINLQI